MVFKYLNRIQQIDQLIRLNNTGNAQEFGEKLGISRKQVYNLIESLKDMGLEIRYDRNLKSFVYAKSYRVNISFEIVELTEDETINTNAGTYVGNIKLCSLITQTLYSFGNHK